MSKTSKSISSYRRTDQLALAQLRAGDQIEGEYACIRKDRLIARNGASYLAIELRDESARLRARVFRNADVLAGVFERGDIISVKGRIELFRDQLQAELIAIERSPESAAQDFLPRSYRDIDELDGFLEHLAREVYEPNLTLLLKRMLGDKELREAWRTVPCTPSSHHAYIGGLLEHTVAVTTLALETAALHPRLNSDLLLTAAIVHDVGKSREYELGADFNLSRAGKALGHVLLGQEIIRSYSAELDEEIILDLLHCVACHHGADAIGTRQFQSAEAIALYRLHALDTSVKAALETG